MIPPNYGAESSRAYQNEVGEASASAIRQAGISYVINLSSVGAHLSQGAGPISGFTTSSSS